MKTEAMWRFKGLGRIQHINFVFSNLTLLNAALKAVIIFIYKHYVRFAQIFKSKASHASNRTMLSSVVLICWGFCSLIPPVLGALA